ncbi:hypothetical protein F443_04805 [Phytophthora nicotianae P1569]|uniref:Uncharacterized protein n=1 Tax=Phytophthora nicotianae P1569 TaxID=1317065 RepID=V9FLL0_PHYNI|nr:hypothetical protein F443_04805 [Phytophthora nicotianae P1569]
MDRPTYTLLTIVALGTLFDCVACDALGLSDYNANGVVYKHERYWNKSATIPSQGSVLLLSSKLNPKTPHKYTEYLLDVSKGDNKELIAFTYTTHGSVAWTFLIDNDYNSQTCGMLLLASYVSNGGDVQSLDKLCLNKMPQFNLAVLTDFQCIYLSTEDVYDGEYNPSLRDIYT